MERSRSKRSYHYEQELDSPPRTKYRRNNPPPPPPFSGRRPSVDRRQRLPDSPPPPAPSPSSGGPTTIFRILCPEARAVGVIGKDGGFIRSLRQETGAWINVHELSPGDAERVIETSDNCRREPDGAPPRFCPAEEAMNRIHSWIIEVGLEIGLPDEEDQFGSVGWGKERDRGKLVSRMVVPRAHVGCLLGKGGKIIEHMRIETRTHIRILPRDQNTPRCVSTSEEVVQVVGDANCVKKAVAIVLSRLKESIHRDRGPFRGRLHSPDRYLPSEEDFENNVQQGSSYERSNFGPRSAGVSMDTNRLYGSQPPGYAFEADPSPANDRLQSFSGEDLVFRILCPNEKVEKIMGVSGGIIEMLRVEIGVDVVVTDLVPGSDERIIVITSQEGPEDELFPAQEALLHIQTQIADLGPDNDNIISTRLLVKANEIGCLEGSNGSLSEIRKLTNANVQILPKEDHPLCAMEADELLQIVGEIKAARKALLQVTEKLRSHLYQEVSMPKDLLLSTKSGPGYGALETSSPNRTSREGYLETMPPGPVYQSTQALAPTQSKDAVHSAGGSLEEDGSRIVDEGRKTGVKRFIGPLVTRSTLEVVIPDHAVPSLMKGSGSKLAQISEMSGATVTLIEDRPEQTEKIVKISGSPEQAERAQSLLQGFILSKLTSKKGVVLLIFSGLLL